MNKTSIEWTDYSSNPIYAVDKVTGKRGWHCVHASPGCKHCYAETLNKRFGTGLSYTVNNNERVEFQLNTKEFDRILAHKKPEKIFVGDMLDIFHKDVPDYFLLDLWTLFRMAHWHTFQVLTKQIDRAKDFLSRLQWHEKEEAYLGGTHGEVLPNVWIGTSAEDQQRADERIPLLLQTPAAVRFISAEPLLGPVDLDFALEVYDIDRLECGYLGALDWVIVGGESGPGARPMHPEWARQLISICKEASVPIFVKQLGSCVVTDEHPAEYGFKGSFSTYGDHPNRGWRWFLKSKKGGDMDEWPEEFRVRQQLHIGGLGLYVPSEEDEEDELTP